MPYKAYKTVLFFVAGGDSFAIGAYIKVPPCQVPEHVGKTVSAMGTHNLHFGGFQSIYLGLKNHMGVSKYRGGPPEWMVYKGKPY